MEFVNPSGLLALFAIAIPIIVHLFNFRRFKKIYFTNVKFLQEVKQESQAKFKLKHLLVLVCRILAVIFLVLAFTQPYIPSKKGKIMTGEKSVSIYIDNSFSMEAVSKRGTLLDEAKQRAKEITENYSAGDRFQLLTNDFEGKHQRLITKEEFIQAVNEVKISSSVKTISEICSRQLDVLNSGNTKNKKAYILSDFQKTISDIKDVKNDTSVATYLIPIAAGSVSNVYIDSCWFASPVRQADKTDQLYVRIKNLSDKTLENNSIKLFINDLQKSPAAYSLEAQSETETILSFTIKETGIQQCKVEISDYPVTFDDVFYFSFNVLKNIHVLNINPYEIPLEQSKSETRKSYINSLYGKDSLFVLSVTDDKKINYSEFGKSNLIVLNGLKNIPSGLAVELNKFIVNGGSLVVFPGTSCDFESYKQFLSALNSNYYEKSDTANTKVDRINYEHVIFSDVFEKRQENIDLPVVYQHYIFTKNTKTNEEALMLLQNGDIFFSRYSYGKGKFYLSAVPLNINFSNLVQHALFVPLMYKIAIYSQPVKKLFYTIGQNEAIEIEKKQEAEENIFHIQNRKNNFDIIPEAKSIEGKTHLYVNDQNMEAGNYYISQNNEKISGASFNYNRKESNLTCFPAEELKKQLQENNLSNFSLVELNSKIASETLKEIGQGKKLWKLCMVLVLFFLAMETLLLRIWKN